MICFNNNLHISNSKKIMEIVMIIALLFANIYIYVRTRFDLNPEREWIQAHVTQTINL